MIVGQTFHLYKKVLEQSIAKFLKEKVMTQSAALAFYMIFSWPSILLIILWTVSRFYREVAIRDALFNESGGIVGHQGEKTRKLGDFIVGSNEEGFTFTDEDAP